MRKLWFVKGMVVLRNNWQLVVLNRRIMVSNMKVVFDNIVCIKGNDCFQLENMVFSQMSVGCKKMYLNSYGLRENAGFSSRRLMVWHREENHGLK